MSPDAIAIGIACLLANLIFFGLAEFSGFLRGRRVQSKFDRARFYTCVVDKWGHEVYVDAVDFKTLLHAGPSPLDSK